MPQRTQPAENIAGERESKTNASGSAVLMKVGRELAEECLLLFNEKTSLFINDEFECSSRCLL